jgi:3-mercaptopropionate dioxygenase
MPYYRILDRAPKGRDEGGAFQTWIRRHDEYDDRTRDEFSADSRSIYTSKLGMTTTRQARPSAGGRSIEPVQHVASGLDELVRGVRSAVSRHANWRETARLVAGELARHLPSPAMLTAEQRIGDPQGYRSHLLHAEADGSFSIVALVWRPGQVTPIHDHVTWCVFGVIQGEEYEEIFTLDEKNGCLVESGTNSNRAAEVGGFAPPGDIHRVRNAGEDTAISIHIYGTDVSRIGSSVRRSYDLPVRSDGSAARTTTPG